MATTLWNKLQREVTLQDMKRWFTGDEGQSGRISEADVDRLLKEAEEEARKRKVGVEVVLRERGFDIPRASQESENSSPRDPEVEASRRELLQSMNWQAIPEADESGSASGQGTGLPTQLEIPAGMFQEEERCRIQAALESPEVLPRLALIAPLEPDQLQMLGERGSGTSLRTAIIGLGLPSDVVLDVVDAEEWTIPHREASDWVDDLMMREIAPYRALRQAQERVRREGGALLGRLVEDESVSGADLLDFLAEKADMEVIREAPKHPVAVKESLYPWVDAFAIVPIAEEGEDSLLLAAAFVAPERVRNALSNALGMSIELKLAPPRELDAWRKNWLGAAQKAGYGAPRSRVIRATGVSKLARGQVEELERAARRGSAVDLVRSIFEAALAARATDIHVEPWAQQGRVRFRIDGVCLEVLHLSRSVYRETIARIKVLAEMDVTERRRPQDGHVRFLADKRPLDMRIASLPTRQGEKIAIRLVDAGHVALTLADIGLNPEEVESVRRVAGRPHGLILATGPVGSGKTTTLYACLSEIDRTQLNVMSIEDPVEIELEGANQVEVNRATGVDFVNGLRALLRQDPDVLLIGEIRDEETAQIGVRAAMTGRLVYSTLHANSAAAAITTLRNFGIPDFVISASLQGVIAQRLVRRICSHCSEDVTLSKEELEALGLKSQPKDWTPKQGRGCERCSDTGYLGRIGLFEFLPVDDELRDMILNGAAQNVMEAHARAQGMHTLNASAVALVAQGLTTPEERTRVLGR